VRPQRREILKAGLGAGLLFMPLPYARVWAQSEGALKLLRAPKMALVMGNSKYKEAPLKNPANDARAIADALKASGFDVTMKVDAGKADMAAAVQAYVQALATKKSVGLFYYDGHGIQLAWKNYMLPVDADIDTIADVQKQAVEVHALMEGLTKAGNPMNVVILDACRDNPFGNLKGVDHKGLSQMDAPTQTLLAFATSPGNVASDGEGANGLYTENLLREIKVPEAKVEDVFKRVRLGVRRKSNGAQIPWESTSLEEDFWFIPPKELKKLSEAEREKQFNEELAIWERIEKATVPGPLEDYLRRYPNGDFSELAQLRLEQVLARQGEKRIQLASQAGNPFTKGSAFTRIAKVGDSFTYRELDMRTKAERRTYTAIVTQVTDTEVIHDSGLVTDLLGNQRRSRDGYGYSPNQFVPQEFAVGKRWRTRFDVTDPRGVILERQHEQTIRIVAREEVTVPAGTFHAFHLEGRGRATRPEGDVEYTVRRWYVPEFQRPVAREEVRQRGDRVPYTQRLELVSYKLA
jgi:hypothetical protein